MLFTSFICVLISAMLRYCGRTLFVRRYISHMMYDHALNRVGLQHGQQHGAEGTAPQGSGSLRPDSHTYVSHQLLLLTIAPLHVCIAVRYMWVTCLVKNTTL